MVQNSANGWCRFRLGSGAVMVMAGGGVSSGHCHSLIPAPCAGFLGRRAHSAAPGLSGNIARTPTFSLEGGAHASTCGAGRHSFVWNRRCVGAEFAVGAARAENV